MQNQIFAATSRHVMLLCISYAVILLVCDTQALSSQTLSQNRVVIDDKDKSNDFYRIEHIEVTDDNNYSGNAESVISYQQQQQYEIDKLNVNETKLLRVDTSKGFDKDRTVLLITTQFKDSCRKNASLPSWKIDKGTSKGTFHLKINYERRLTEQDFYFCVKNGDEEWHLGISSAFRLPRSDNDHHVREIVKRQVTDVVDQPKLIGFTIIDISKEPELEDSIPILKAGTSATFRIFGENITEKTMIGLTSEALEFGKKCHKIVTDTYEVTQNEKTNAVVDITLPQDTMTLFICATNDGVDFYHQGTDRWLEMKSKKPFLPLWVQLFIIGTCLCFSALFSGLNLGLMSLDRTDLKILTNTGSENERKHARAIQPVRDHGNFLLCSILLGNVLVNSTFTILLDSLTSGLIAVLCSTLLIVIFGEITPQAICSRHGLAVGARTIIVTKFVMILTFPLSYPTSKLLDYLLGEEIGTYYNRERLKELVKVTTDVNDLDKDEVNIISGVLEMRKKTVGDIMTPIDDAYMLPITAILDFETISEIMNSGYSRIPVYEGDRKNILSLLYIKDLAFVDTDDNTPLRTLCEFYQNPCHFVFDDMTLDVMFKQFKEGNKGHMAFVHRVNNDGEGDPFYETIGLVTLEDVIEELIQAEIMDETDRITDNRTKSRRSRPAKQDFSCFIGRNETQKVRISPQLTLATFQFMSTTLEPFKRECISENILRRLLNQDIYRHIKNKAKEKSDPSIVIFQQGKPVDFFVLILEGRVEVTVGRENLIFESGPFTHFGLQALVQNIGIDSPQQQIVGSQVLGSLQSLNMDAMLRHTFIPDYSVKALTDVAYLAIKRSLYMAAKRATLMEQSKRLGGDQHSNEPLDDEVEKLLHSLDEDDSAVHTNLNSPRMSFKAVSAAPSPTSQQNFHHHQTSSHQQLSQQPHHSESENGIRVTYSQNNSTGNHVINFSNSQKNSVEIADDSEAEQPLLTKQPSQSKPS